MELSLSGLRLTPPDWRRAAIAVGFSIVAVTAFILVLDCVLFRGSLPQPYVAFFTSPLVRHLPVISATAMMEEVKFRLLVMTALAFLASVLLRRPPPAVVMIAIIVAAQWVNVGGLVLANPLYASLRYLAVGCVWGWLYWRYGWLAALVGHASSHLLLDPLLAVGLVWTA